ncbi:MAG TPA: plastocyanin/azurin family copper-binding protein [Egibacteraceae bacterium]|nr:plastocyanin/azurin family copper-binding protein [Egibacteraceae bacterium]
MVLLRSLTVGLALLTAAALTGCAGGEAAGGGQGEGETLRFVGNDQLQFSQPPERTSAGRRTIELVVEGAVNHNVSFDEISRGEPVVEADGGETATGTIELEPGTYTYFCSVPGHREAGMEGTLVVD